MKVELRIEGAKELEANLATLGQRIHRKVVRKAVREGQRPMLAAAKRNAISMISGTMGAKIAKALQIRAPRRQRPGAYSLHVQMKSGVEGFISTTASGKKHFIPAAIEFGHIAGRTFVSPIPYIRDAAESSRGDSMRRLTDELRKGLLREAILARYK